MTIGSTTAAEIKFFPANGDIQKWCMIVTDIFIDTTGNPIAATDVVIESSLEYVDFVPTKTLFPYFLPPTLKNNKIYIAWFTDKPKKLITWSGSIGKLFLRQKNISDTDGTIKLFFAGAGKTHDSNLSILWWIDVLDRVGAWYYRLTDEWPCQYPIDHQIVWWSSHMSPEDALTNTLKEIERKQIFEQIFNWKTITTFVSFIIILTILFIYIKRIWKSDLLNAN